MKSPILLEDEQRDVLERWSRSRTVSLRWRERAQIILAATEKVSDAVIAARLGTTRHRVARWRRRFASGGVEALKKDRPRAGRPPRVDAAKVKQIVRLTTQTQPTHATQWSTRSMAKRVGVSDTTVLRVWHAHGLKPHRVRTFKLSNDPQFTEKLEDIVGLYLAPPEHALVLCCEKSDSGAGSYAAWTADQERPSADDDTRLQAQRHHYAVCRAEHSRRTSHRALPEPAYACRVVEVPQEG
jgi:transposase